MPAKTTPASFLPSLIPSCIPLFTPSVAGVREEMPEVSSDANQMLPADPSGATQSWKREWRISQ